jgi:diaminohydroxyphosphoribosylaminopyrimidine deaminase/5-amino-6-(5-phosphoribosylamino)uracil reductase
LVDDNVMMRRAMALADSARGRTSPNPWVGAVLVTASGAIFDGATEPPGGMHAEVAALAAARAAGDCAHYGRTGPCADAIVAANVARVMVGITDPDPQVAGRGIARLRTAGIDVVEGVEAQAISDQLAPYLKHRRTGRPWVTLKLAATLDGRTAAPDGSSRWITGEAARADGHRLRAQADAVLVGSGTVRADDPALTVRHVPGRDPLRVVLGRAPADARVHPALELSGDLGAVLDELGARGIMSVLVEGGATVAHSFHQAGLVDRYVLYLAPALFGGDDASPVFRGPGASTIGDVWRGRMVSVERLGDDLRVEVAAATAEPIAAAEARAAVAEAPAAAEARADSSEAKAGTRTEVHRHEATAPAAARA